MLVTLFADASWCPAMKVGGWGVWVKSARNHSSTYGVFKQKLSFSNEAELCAVANGLHHAIITGVAQDGDVILVQSDCQRVVGIIDRILLPRTKAEKKAVAFINAWIAGHKLTLRSRHVKGHTVGGKPRFWVNRECDRLARKGLNQARKGNQ